MAASALVLLLSVVFAWLAALVGLLIPSPEAVAQAGIVWLLPFIFASSAFVPVQTMPDWLRTFAEHQPVSLMMDAVRGLLLNQPASPALWQAVTWCGGLLLVLIPLDVWVYGRRTAR
jgi:ABC-2 type transport system permease protein/oleandomycin transport system permease protein